MKIEANSLLGITSILNRDGRKIATHLVDKARDSLDHDREKRGSETPQREDRRKTDSPSKDEDGTSIDDGHVSTLNITA